MANTHVFIVLILDKESGGLTVEVPDFPGYITKGETVEKAIEGFIEVLKKDSDPVPKPSKLEVVIKLKAHSKENPIFKTVKVAA